MVFKLPNLNLVLCISRSKTDNVFCPSLAPLIRHSKQNVAAGMSTTASSNDNYAAAGCNRVDCEEVTTSGRFVVDGDINTCFRSQTEDKPWLMIELNDYHPISLVRIMTSKETSLKLVEMSVGNYNDYSELR